MNRADALAALSDRNNAFDVVVVGGGATGAGIALDAASRGFSTALIERDDFGSGTSSKSTKLIHGGVRYLAKAEFGLVREALHERTLLLNNASHLVEPQAFIIPFSGWLEKIKYTVGLRLYDRLAGRCPLPDSVGLSARDINAALPSLALPGVTGGIRYWDAKFDDARLLWTIIESAIAHGACPVNHCTVIGFEKQRGKLSGIVVTDNETNTEFTVSAKVAINATGIYSDEICAFDDPTVDVGLAPSQGSHIVIDADFHRSEQALLIPKTHDGRVMFVVPWNGKAVVGTTDVAVEITDNPIPRADEIEQILDTVGNYLAERPRRSDIRACFAGIRPLAIAHAGMATSNISREHRIDTSASGLISVTGGKWTTYRKMAEDCVDLAAEHLSKSPSVCRTETIDLAGANSPASANFPHYGHNGAAIDKLIAQTPSLAEKLSPGLPYCKAQVVWAVRSEMARGVADVLARRTRALFIDARAAIDAAPLVAQILAEELQRDDAWMVAELARFEAYAAGYLVD